MPPYPNLSRWSDLPDVPCCVGIKVRGHDLLDGDAIRFWKEVRRRRLQYLILDERGGYTTFLVRAKTITALFVALNEMREDLLFTVIELGLLPFQRDMNLSLLQALASWPEELVSALGRRYEQSRATIRTKSGIQKADDNLSATTCDDAMLLPYSIVKRLNAALKKC